MAITHRDHDTDLRPHPGPADHRGPWHHLRTWRNPRFLLGIIVAFVAVEAGARVVEAYTDDRASAPTVFGEHHQRLEERDVDVIALGSSSMGAAFWAPGLDDAGLACTAYSAWLTSPTMVDIAAHAEQEVLSTADPRQIVVGVTIREFNAGSPTRDDPELDEFLDPDDNPFTDHLAVLRIRDLIQDPDRFGNAVLGRTHEQTGQDGHHLASLDHVIADESAAHRQQEADEMATYTLDNADIVALDELLTRLHDEDIDVVLVNLPVTDIFVDMAPNGTADYDRYLDAIAGVAARTGTGFFDGNKVDLDHERQFADVNHLNRDGSQAFTAALGASGLLERPASCPTAPA